MISDVQQKLGMFTFAFVGASYVYEWDLVPRKWEWKVYTCSRMNAWQCPVRQYTSLQTEKAALKNKILIHYPLLNIFMNLNIRKMDSIKSSSSCVPIKLYFLRLITMPLHYSKWLVLLRYLQILNTVFKMYVCFSSLKYPSITSSTEFG